MMKAPNSYINGPCGENVLSTIEKGLLHIQTEQRNTEHDEPTRTHRLEGSAQDDKTNWKSDEKYICEFKYNNKEKNYNFIRS